MQTERNQPEPNAIQSLKPENAQPDSAQTAAKNTKRKTAQKLRILRHQLLGKLWLLKLPPLLIDVMLEVKMMSEPPQADIILLRRRGKQWSKKQRADLPDGIRDNPARYHLLECKFTESANELAVQQALGYDSLFLRNQDLKRENLQTYLLSAKTPEAEFLARLGYGCTGVAGVYVTQQPVIRQVMLLVLNELSNEPHNELLRLFASRQSVREQTMATVMSHHAHEWPDELWAVIFALQRLYEMEEQSMKQELTVDMLIEAGHKIRQQVIATLKPQELDEQVRQQVIASALPSERVAGLAPQERLAGLEAAEMRALFAELERLLGQQPASQAAVPPEDQPAKAHPTRAKSRKKGKQ